MIYNTSSFHKYVRIYCTLVLFCFRQFLEQDAIQTEIVMYAAKQKTSPKYLARNKVKLICGGKEYFDLLTILNFDYFLLAFFLQL